VNKIGITWLCNSNMEGKYEKQFGSVARDTRSAELSFKLVISLSFNRPIGFRHENQHAVVRRLCCYISGNYELLTLRAICHFCLHFVAPLVNYREAWTSKL